MTIWEAEYDPNDATVKAEKTEPKKCEEFPMKKNFVPLKKKKNFLQEQFPTKMIK